MQNTINFYWTGRLQMIYKVTCWIIKVTNVNKLIPLQAEFESVCLPSQTKILKSLGEDKIEKLLGNTDNEAVIVENLTIWHKDKFGFWIPIKN